MTKKDLAQLFVAQIKYFEQTHLKAESILCVEINDDRGGTGTFEVTMETTKGNKTKYFKENI